MKATAAVFFEVGRKLEIRDVDVAPPKAGEVLVRMAAAGICHSDLHVMTGHLGAPLPAILGHEGAGVVAETGPGVTSVKPGDHVIPLWRVSCGECEHCSGGRPALCAAGLQIRSTGRLADGTSRFSLDGRELKHFNAVSTFSQYSVIPECSVLKIPSDLPLDRAALLGCGVITGVGAVFNCARVRPASSVVVFGTGGIGLNVVQGARMVGANMIVGVDLNPAREVLARKFGLTHFIDPKGKDVVAEIVELTGGGADYSFECIGNVEVMRQALECCHRGWGVSVIIGVAGAGQEIRTRPFQLVTGRVWKGTAFGGARGRTDVPKIVDWYMQGRINIDDLITHVLPLERINDAFQLMHEGKSIRSVVVY
jgi:S-(hydroxymethyl)glutathione dehydrogenase/alcohol dehydrogenase